MALPLFFERLADDLRFELLLGIHFLQPGIFLRKFLQPLHVRYIHAAVLGSPFIKTGAAHAVLAAQLGHRNAGFGFFKDLNYLAFWVTRLPICRISVSGKFYFLPRLISGGITRRLAAVFRYCTGDTNMATRKKKAKAKRTNKKVKQAKADKPSS